MYIGLDIGGTKCAVISADDRGNIRSRIAFPTESVQKTLAKFYEEIDSLIKAAGSEDRLQAIGISCGGPLDEKKGLIQSPPNLPGWDEIPITRELSERYGVPAHLRNDANACALAEWRFGAGQGTENMVFLTFGTGMGAGLILNGRLYSGTNGNAGEVGHMRLENEGPVGYRKKGSFEGFCSGGGIARLAETEALKSAENVVRGASCVSAAGYSEIRGKYSAEAEACMAEDGRLTAKSLAEAAKKGNPFAIGIYQTVGEKLGKGLAVIVDVLNPERIVIGSIYERSGELLRESMMRVLKEEALPQSLSVCEIVPAALGDRIGDVAAIAAAMEEA